MRRRVMVVVAVLILAHLPSCGSRKPYARDSADATLFGPANMRIHPIFTQPSDWNGDGKLDGIEALLELQDQFGDPTKASGEVMFELFTYRPYDADSRGERLANWNGQLSTIADQSERWNRTSRTYGFQLEYAALRDNRPYVLTATFELSSGGRFFDRIVLEPREVFSGSPQTRPAGQ